MRIYEVPFFGLLSGVMLRIALPLITVLAQVNVLYAEWIGKWPLFMGLLPASLVLFCIALRVRLKSPVRNLNRIYFLVAVFTFIFYLFPAGMVGGLLSG